ncbi:MAG TPA: hypothetical protein EYH06_02615 [Chromatiales bacterium]|nr:hypothetical protein [Thiotrichales bacterium]HIP67465.1 hypothetical protein [Chromatiales bacterium]
MFRFLPGIIFIQLATAALLFALYKAQFNQELMVAIALLGLIMSMLAAFWFSAIASHRHKDMLTKTIEQHAREREDIRVKAEKQKSKIIKQSQQQISKEASRAHAKANFKVGAAFTAAAGVGGLMIFTQFITVGLLILATTGGGLLGYMMRLRQERQIGKKMIMTGNNIIDAVKGKMESGKRPGG